MSETYDEDTWEEHRPSIPGENEEPYPIPDTAPALDLSELSKSGMQAKKNKAAMEDHLRKTQASKEMQRMKHLKKRSRLLLNAEKARIRAPKKERTEKKADLKSDDESKAEIIAEAMRIMTRYGIEPTKKPSVRLSLQENHAILKECVSLLGLKRGRAKVQGLLTGLTEIIQSFCASDSPLPFLRTLHADKPPGLVSLVCEGPDFEDIVTDMTMEYGAFFAEMGPISRYMLAVVGALTVGAMVQQRGDDASRAGEEILKKTQAMKETTLDSDLKARYASI